MTTRIEIVDEGPDASAGAFEIDPSDGARTGTPESAIGRTGPAGVVDTAGGCCSAAAEGAVIGTSIDDETSISDIAAGAAAMCSTTLGIAGIPTTGTFTAAGLADVVGVIGVGLAVCCAGGFAGTAGWVWAGTGLATAGVAGLAAAGVAGISRVIVAF